MCLRVSLWWEQLPHFWMKASFGQSVSHWTQTSVPWNGPSQQRLTSSVTYVAHQDLDKSSGMMDGVTQLPCLWGRNHLWDVLSWGVSRKSEGYSGTGVFQGTTRKFQTGLIGASPEMHWVVQKWRIKSPQSPALKRRLVQVTSRVPYSEILPWL